MDSELRPAADLPEGAFLVRDALLLGYGRGALAHPRWHRPFRGVRCARNGGDSLSDRAMGYVPRLRAGERFSHATALALLGCPIRVPMGAPVDVSSPVALGRVECRGVTGHRHSASDAYQVDLPDCDEWVPVTSPLDAVREAALALPFPELVVALDYLLLPDPNRYDPHLRVHPGELARFAERVSGRGSVRFRAAAALARAGAESRMETLMRLAGIRVGLPEPELQKNVYSPAGDWIGRFDLADARTRSLYEYDGEQHSYSRSQRRRDPKKHQAARDAGWRILVLFNEDLLEGLVAAGRKMLEFAGYPQRSIRPAVARLLDEYSADDTESAGHLPRYREPV